MLHLLVHDSESGGRIDAPTSFLITIFWTKCFFFFTFSIWCFVTVCVKWHGDVNRMLLLKLLDAQQEQAATDIKAE
jgi:hypothetical protein